MCASSQGLRNKVNCLKWTKGGFPHENGREVADPFGGKDLSTFEYTEASGRSLGIKIDLIAEWLVTQARGCPSGCGNSARIFLRKNGEMIQSRRDRSRPVPTETVQTTQTHSTINWCVQNHIIQTNSSGNQIFGFRMATLVPRPYYPNRKIIGKYP